MKPEQGQDPHGPAGAFCSERRAGRAAAWCLLIRGLHYKGWAELGRGQGSRTDLLSELGGTSECRSQGYSPGRKDPPFLHHLLCTGFMAGPPHKPHSDPHNRPVRYGWAYLFLKGLETEAQRGQAPDQPSKTGLTTNL